MLASVKNLSISFNANKNKPNQVVKGVSFSISKGETLALVGESGSGKSLSALALMKLLPQSAHSDGDIIFEGENIHDKTEREMQKIRGSRISMIFQEPMTALNPLHTIEKQLTEILEHHSIVEGANAIKDKINQLLIEVGLEKLKDRLNAYPHQLSGGERQRVMIAMALACEPELLLADEPTTAVDVTLQEQIIKLLKNIQKKRGLAILFITHDLKAVEKIAHRIAVLKSGELVETTETKAFFKNPAHEYSRKLLASRPKGSPPTPVANENVILEANSLSVRFPTKKNIWGKTVEWNQAVKGASLSLRQGHSLGIVGESGSGKSSLAMALINLQKSDGSILFMGNRLSEASREELKSLRGDLQMVFQDPFGSLNPRMSVVEIVGEGLRVHHPQLSSDERRSRAGAALEDLGLSSNMLDRYPHEFSGGQRQRIAIARAMILEPKLVVMDEPTSALDVTVQAQIIGLLRELQVRTNVAYLFISHDLAVVRAVCHNILVMKDGVIIEQGTVKQIFEAPRRHYTRTLIQASAVA